MKIKISLFCVCLCFVSTITHADTIRDANRLLRVTNLGNQFDLMALDQTRKIIRTYSSIVNMSVALSLPQTGIVQILAENLSQKELHLLIDFYSNRGLPPMEINTFKNTVSKANEIERISLEYIFEHSDSCVERDAELIGEFLTQQALIESENTQRPNSFDFDE